MSKRDRKRRDTVPPAEPLRSTPFADLAERLPGALPQQRQVPPQDAPAAEILRPQKHPYQVARTRKGAYDLTFERRAKGKGVTVLRRVTGDLQHLMNELKKRCGAGGAIREDAIELQGDHRKAIEFYLRGQGL